MPALARGPVAKVRSNDNRRASAQSSRLYWFVAVPDNLRSPFGSEQESSEPNSDAARRGDEHMRETQRGGPT